MGRFDPVLTIAPVEHIDIRPAPVADDIIPDTRQIGFGPACPGQDVIACRSNRIDLIQKRVECPDRAIAEHHLLDCAIADHKGIVGKFEGQDQVVAARGHPFDPHIERRVADQFQPVEPACILDHVLPVAALEAVGVIAQTGAQEIRPLTAFQRIGTAAAADQIVAGAGLCHHPSGNQVVGVPADRVGKDDFRHGAGACRPHQNDLVAGCGEGQDQVGAIARGLAHHRLLRGEIGDLDPCEGRSRQHLDAVYPVACAEDHRSVLTQQDAVLAGAGVNHEARVEVSGVIGFL